jgi:hypothetical protein
VNTSPGFSGASLPLFFHAKNKDFVAGRFVNCNPIPGQVPRGGVRGKQPCLLRSRASDGTAVSQVVMLPSPESRWIAKEGLIRPLRFCQ